MKIWVCRHEHKWGSSYYRLMEEACKPRRNFNGAWYCGCGDPTTSHDIDGFCTTVFKQLTGLKRHLKPGTKKLMTWTLPLARQGKVVK